MFEALGSTRVVVGLGLAAYLLAGAGPTEARSIHERVRRDAPHHVGKSPKAPVRAGWIALERGESFAAAGTSPELAVAADAHLREMEEVLAGLGVPSLPSPIAPRAGGAPEIYVGDPAGFYAPEESLDEEERSRHGRDVVWIRIVDPASGWKRSAGDAAKAGGLDHWIVVRMELSDYPVAQLDLKGSKAVRLGTGDTRRIPWLTSLDQPVEVVQYVGALYRADGRFVRGGAEAFHALRTPFKESMFRVQRTLTAESFAEALAARRHDLSGSPPAWRVALAHLVEGLLGRPVATTMETGSAETIESRLPYVASPPRFEEWLVEERFRGTPAPVDLASHPRAQMFRTRLREGAASGPNFAGRYTSVRWGCGTMCEEFLIVDAVTGRVFDGLTAPPGFHHRLDSRLLVFDPPPPAAEGERTCGGCTAAYYVWERERIELIPPERWVGSRPPPADAVSLLLALREEEKPILARFGPEIVRPTWDRLAIEARGGARRVLTDEVLEGALVRTYVLRDRLESIDRVLVEVVLVPEGGEFLLVETRSAEIVEVDSPPVVSPAGARIVTASLDLVAGHRPNRLRVYRVVAGGLEIEWEIEPREWGPADPVWIDEHTIRLRRATVNMQATPFELEYSSLRLERDGVRWRLREVTSP